MERKNKDNAGRPRRASDTSLTSRGNISILVRRSLSFILSFHRFFCGWRCSRSVFHLFLRGRAPATLRRPASPPPIPIFSIPILVAAVSVPVSVPVPLAVAIAVTVSLVTPARTARTLPVAARGRGPPVVAPHGRRGVLGPLGGAIVSICALRDKRGSTYLDA